MSSSSRKERTNFSYQNTRRRNSRVSISSIITPQRVDGRESPAFKVDATEEEKKGTKPEDYQHHAYNKLKSSYAIGARHVHNNLFRGIPETYPLYKKLALLKNNSLSGTMWEAWLGILAFGSVLLYVVETYTSQSWHAVDSYQKMDTVITSFFTLDFAIGLCIGSSLFGYLLSINTFVDIIAIVPFYVELGAKSLNFKLGIFRFFRIFRLLRVVRIFRVFKSSASPTKQAIANLVVTLFCTIFIGAGIFQLFENDVKQLMQYQCNYIGPKTRYRPSCATDKTFKSYNGSCVSMGDDVFAGMNCGSNGCDCHVYGCHSFYNRYDQKHKPSGVHCSHLHRTFFDCVYFMVVTIGTIGFGDIYPTTELSRFVVVIIISFSLIVIPLQLQRLAELVLTQARWRGRYQPMDNDEYHVVVCGHVHDRMKMERLLREFFHPTRVVTRSHIRMVIMSPSEPNESLMALLHEEDTFRNNVVFLVGSTLNVDDLVRSGIHYALGVFVLGNFNSNEQSSKCDDEATVLRVLSVSNFDPLIPTFVQLVKHEDRMMLESCDIDVLLCHDEFRTTLQARNAVVHGITTLISNIFTTVGTYNFLDSSPLDNPLTCSNTVDENAYICGAEMEPCYIKLSAKHAAALHYDWTLMVESIYLYFGAMLVGVCYESPSEGRKMVINPSNLEIFESAGDEHNSYASSNRAFFERYNVGVLLCATPLIAAKVVQGLSDPATIDKLLQSVVDAEASFHVRTGDNLDSPSSTTTPRARAKSQADRSWRILSMMAQTTQKGQVDEGCSPHQFAVSEFAEISARIASKSFHHCNGLHDALTTKIGDHDSLSQHGDKEDGERMTDAARKHLAKRASESQKSRSHHDLLRHVTLKSVGADDYSPMPVSPPLSLSSHPPEGSASHSHHKHRDIRNASAIETAHHHLAINNLPDDDSLYSDDGDETATPNTPNISGWSKARHAVAGGAVKALGALYDYKKKMQNNKFGHASRHLRNASPLHNHIIAFGRATCIETFVAELRRPLINYMDYHSIVIACDKEPDEWEDIARKYDDVYWIKGDLTKGGKYLRRVNIAEASALILLADRANLKNSTVGNEHLDTDTLFQYLGIEKLIESDIYFSAELFFENNMAILNTSAVRTANRRTAEKLVQIDAEEQRMHRAFTTVTPQKSLQPIDRRTGGVMARHNSKKSLIRSIHNDTKEGEIVRTTADMSPTLQTGNNLSLFKRLRQRVRRAFWRALGYPGPSRTASRVAPPSTPSMIDLQKQQSVGSLSAQASNIAEDDTSGVHTSNLRDHLVDRMQDGFDSTLKQMRAATGKALSRDFFDVGETHQMLPVFASGRAFVPSVLDTLLVNSMFDPYNPLFCERLIIGQKFQTMLQIDLPSSFVGSTFVSLFRAFISRNLYVIALYRCPNVEDSVFPLPYVYTCPNRDTVLKSEDRIFVFANPINLEYALNTWLHNEFERKDESIYLTTSGKEEGQESQDQESPFLEKNGKEPEPPTLFIEKKEKNGLRLSLTEKLADDKLPPATPKKEDSGKEAEGYQPRNIRFAATVLPNGKDVLPPLPPTDIG